MDEIGQPAPTGDAQMRLALVAIAAGVAVAFVLSQDAQVRQLGSFGSAAEGKPGLAHAALREARGPSLPELIDQTAGGISDKAIDRYGDDFGAYWKSSATGREGKVFEAVAADDFNTRMASLGSPRRLTPTASVGLPSAPEDLVLMGEDGKPVCRVQAKMGFERTLNAIADPKYSQMQILTTQDTFDEISAAISDQMKRGRLPGKLQRAADAIESGRLWRALPCGSPLPKKAAIATIAERHYRARYHQKIAMRLPVAGNATPPTPPRKNVPPPNTQLAGVTASKGDLSQTPLSAAEGAGRTIDKLPDAASSVAKTARGIAWRAAAFAGVAYEAGSKT